MVNWEKIVHDFTLPIRNALKNPMSLKPQNVSEIELGSVDLFWLICFIYQ